MCISCIFDIVALKTLSSDVAKNLHLLSFIGSVQNKLTIIIKSQKKISNFKYILELVTKSKAN